ncbi:MAG: hypothetical protein WCY41_03785 [Candidatus Micrarchaeia archaeon]
MSYTFKYLTVERIGFPPAKVPHLVVTLIGKENRIFNTAALVDSGADTCAMPKSVAEILGFDLGKAEETKIASASGFIDARKINVTIVVNLMREKRTILAPFNVIMGDFEPPVILGRAGFFENFHICFSEREKKFSLKPV